MQEKLTAKAVIVTLIFLPVIVPTILIVAMAKLVYLVAYITWNKVGG